MLSLAAPAGSRAASRGDGSDRSILREIVTKYRETAPKLSESMEVAIPEGLTVFDPRLGLSETDVATSMHAVTQHRFWCETVATAVFGGRRSQITCSVGNTRLESHGGTSEGGVSGASYGECDARSWTTLVCNAVFAVSLFGMG